MPGRPWNLAARIASDTEFAEVNRNFPDSLDGICMEMCSM